MSQQSQLDFLGGVEEWDMDKCRQNMDSVLPEMLKFSWKVTCLVKLFPNRDLYPTSKQLKQWETAGTKMKFKESTYIEEGIGLLQTICNNFIPVIPLEEVEDRIFSHISEPTCSLVKDVLNKIHLNVEGALKDTAEELKEVIIECLQWLACIAECVETCAQQVQQLSATIPLSCIQSLPVCAIGVLRQTYIHCKESSTLYGNLLDDLAEPLSILFKKAHSMQLALLSLLDKTSVPNLGLEEHVSVLCEVCNGLFEMCKVVTSLDIKLVVGLWKGISRLCSQNLKLLKDRLDVCPLIIYICEEVTSGYSYLFQLCPSANGESLSQGDDKAFTKCVKVQGFLMKVLVALLRDFVDYLGPCEEQILKLLLYILRCLPPCLSAFSISDGQESEIRCQVSNAVVPILQHLVTNRAFRIHLTSGVEVLSPEDNLPLLLLQLSVLDVLPKCEVDVVDCWLMQANHEGDTPCKNLLMAIFQSVKSCYVETRVPVMLPGPMVEGKPQSQVSLYQHVAVHLCGFIGACSARHFHILETNLLQTVLSPDDLCSLLATDCWCFMARYGSASLCNGHVRLLVQTLLAKGLCSRSRGIKSGNNCAKIRLSYLIQRLLKFLSPEHQTSLVDLYPPEQNVDLWLTLTLAPLCDKVQTSVGKALVMWSIKVLDADSGKANAVLKALEFLSQLLALPSLVSSCLGQKQQATLVDIVCQVWANQQLRPNEFGPIREEIMMKLLPVTRHLLSVMETANILQVVKALHHHLKTCSGSVPLLLICTQFMCGLASCQFNPCPEQGELLSIIPKLFYQLLTSSHPLVQTNTLSSFSQFASHTRYEECIPLCLQSDDVLQTRVNNFLQQIPYNPGDQPFVTIDYLKQQQQRRDAKGQFKQPQNSESPSDARMATTTHDDEHQQDKIKSDNDKPKRDEDIVTVLEERDSYPPAKKVKLDQQPLVGFSHQDSTATLNNKTESSILSSGTLLTFPNVLERLKEVADDLEAICTKSCPPEDFITQSKVVLSRINDCVNVPSSWFDSLA